MQFFSLYILLCCIIFFTFVSYRISFCLFFFLVEKWCCLIFALF